ncbi:MULTISPECIES: cysteine hydrolase family protein [unclassified Streptomyces]|uniref:cysteine hydrolase family protein n=1 Tax=unclassified Streptomyces TaxID=2593676 RepID=UPI00224E89CC|nr:MULTISPECIES: cysteine hydrolase family protein [unclassified Streptomyces]MCX4528885.1 cysteine hydrolase [Streptomyces sp. NBC_01551]MCX4540444.1 cysteine hydrolase [Streptomyces sp. NBC_01565]
MTNTGFHLAENAALLVIDVQKGFDDPSFWGPRNNPEAEANIAALMDAWQETGRPLVLVRHSSLRPGSVLAPEHPGHAFKDFVEERAGRAVLLVDKTVNSSFYGTPDLADWLTARGIGQLVVAGIQTNMCVETTARMAGNLGYEVLVPLDATHTFDLTAGPAGPALTADQLATATAVNLQGGGFARVVTTADLLAAAPGPAGV